MYLKSISEAILEDFQKRSEDVSYHISKYVLSFKHNINEVINIFTSENMENTPSSRIPNVFSHELILRVAYFPEKRLCLCKMV